MINKEILKIAGQLQNVVSEQMKQAKQSLEGIPEGETKRKLTDLLSKASKGGVTQEDAQREIEKIVKNAS